MNTNNRRPLPVGYRQGIITAITVLLGFSLLFLRFWGFEAPGQWTPAAVVTAALMSASIVLQLIALWRALQVADDDEIEYRKTLLWFLVSVITLMASVALAGLVYAGVLAGQRG